ncbi:TPA: hypothetical protein EYP66_23055 [Candidatus Poribacteria bacterium]|nr:hypothetical protein [Candidatus Poribacteria bacterium]
MYEKSVKLMRMGRAAGKPLCPFNTLSFITFHSIMLSKSKITFLLFLLVVVGCASHSAKVMPPTTGRDKESPQLQPKPSAEASYPAWFWNMPHFENNLFAVGFSETFFHPENSTKNAIKDGIERLAKYLSVHIKGEHGLLSSGGRIIYSVDNIQEELSPSVLSFVEEHHQVAATYAGKKYTFVLLCLGEGDTKNIAVPLSAAPMPSKPRWVTTLPKKSGYMYALGHSNPYYREVNSWRIAEKNARISLALSLESKVRGLAKQLNASMDTISTVSTDVQLNRVQVIARWKHPEHNACHVLVRMPLVANEEAIKNLLKSALSKKEQQQELSQEEIIQRAFDELDRSTEK